MINGNEQLVWKCLAFEIAPAEDYADGSVTSWQHKVLFGKAKRMKSQQKATEHVEIKENLWKETNYR